MGDNLDKKKIWVTYLDTYFSMRNPYMKFQNPSMHIQNLCYASKSVQCKNAQYDKGP